MLCPGLTPLEPISPYVLNMAMAICVLLSRHFNVFMGCKALLQIEKEITNYLKVLEYKKAKKFSRSSH